MGSLIVFDTAAANTLYLRDELHDFGHGRELED